MYVKCRFSSWIDNNTKYHTHLKETSCKQRIKMIQYFPKPLTSFGGNINVKVDLSNYATKKDLEKCSTR